MCFNSYAAGSLQGEDIPRDVPLHCVLALGAAQVRLTTCEVATPTPGAHVAAAVQIRRYFTSYATATASFDAALPTVPLALGNATQRCFGQGYGENADAALTLVQWLKRAGAFARRNWATFDVVGMRAGIVLLAGAGGLAVGIGCGGTRRVVRAAWPRSSNGLAPSVGAAPSANHATWRRVHVLVTVARARGATVAQLVACGSLAALPLAVPYVLPAH